MIRSTLMNGQWIGRYSGTNSGQLVVDLDDRGKTNAPTEYQPLPDVQSWKDFKAFVTGLEYRRFIFRGQQHPFRLRKGFHRSGRADLPRFLNEDIRALHRHLSVRTSHVFNLGIPDENGAFFNLV
jgi:hypothetical protein